MMAYRGVMLRSQSHLPFNPPETILIYTDYVVIGPAAL